MEEKRCLNCGKILIGKQQKYCSNACQREYQSKEYIDRWQRGLESGLSGDDSLSKYIRHYLLQKQNYKCEKCGWGEENPYTHTIPLEIHHIDGNHTNNKEENLQVLCPNCHSLTPNYKAANRSSTRIVRRSKIPKKKRYCAICGKEITSKATLCVDCYKKQERQVERPSREELKDMIRKIPFTEIAKMYNVSDKAITKWCIAEQLPSRKKDIKTYSDEEWALV